MSPQSLALRVDSLEHRVDTFEVLPPRLDRLESQILQTRDELRGEIGDMGAQLRAEMMAMRDGLRAEMVAMRDGLRVEMVTMRDELRGEMSAMGTQLRAEMKAQGDQLRQEIRDGDVATQRVMRVLHEEIIDRLKLLQEGRHDSSLPSAARTKRSNRGSTGTHALARRRTTNGKKR